MKIRNLIQMGLIGAALAVSASAQQYGPPPQQYNGGYEQRYEQRADRRDIWRDVRHRNELVRRVEQDRRDVEHERRELRHSNWSNAGHESRELRAAQERLNRDLYELRAMDNHIGRDEKPLPPVLTREVLDSMRKAGGPDLRLFCCYATIFVCCGPRSY